MRDYPGVGREDQCVQRNRGTEEQRNRGTEEQRNRGTEEQRNRGTEGTEDQRNSGNRGPFEWISILSKVFFTFEIFCGISLLFSLL